MSSPSPPPPAGKLDISRLFSRARTLPSRAFQLELLVHVQELMRNDHTMIGIWHPGCFIAAVMSGHDRSAVFPEWHRTTGQMHDVLLESALASPHQAVAINWTDPLMQSARAKPWRDFIGRMGLHHALGVSVPVEGMAGSMFIALGRAEADDPFTQQDIDYLTEAAPHLMGAWVVNRIGTSAMLGISDANGTPTAITLPDGWILFCNTAFADAWATLSALDSRIEAPCIPGAWFIETMPHPELDAILRPHGWSLWVDCADDGYRVELRSVAPEGPIDQLTAREREVSRLYSQGYSHKDIGRVLTVAPNTVRVHLHRIFSKLGITSRGELRALFDTLAEGNMKAAPHPAA